MMVKKMEMESFSLDTSIKFFIIELQQNLKSLILIFSIIYSFQFLGILNNLFMRVFFPRSNMVVISLPIPLFAITLLIGLIMFASNAFTKIYEKKWTIFYYTLPGSGLEKVVSKFIFGIIFYYLVSFVVMVFSFGLTYGLASLLQYPTTLAGFNTIGDVFMKGFWIYFYVGSLFFFFSTVWESNSFFKTIGFVFVALIILSIIVSLIGYLLIILRIYNPSSTMFSFQEPYFYQFIQNKALQYILKVIYILVPFAFYIGSYFSYLKKQVRVR